VSHVPRCSTCVLFLFQHYVNHRDLHSFPTRRSSDLGAPQEQPAAPRGRAVLRLLPVGRGHGRRRAPPARPRARPPHDRLRQVVRSEEHTSELQSRENLVCRLLLEKKKNKTTTARELS